MNKLQKREIFTTGLQVREAGEGQESRIITGYAIRFNESSVDLSPDWADDKFVEIITPGAVTEKMLAEQDFRLTMFHDRQLILGRSNKGKGTLKYFVEPEGVRFECEMPKTADGDKALELVRRGDITGCSFSFSTDFSDPKSVSVVSANNGNYREVTATVMKIEKIHDFTLAATPAYPTTSVEARDALMAQAPKVAEPEPQERELNEAKVAENQERENQEIKTSPCMEKKPLSAVVRENLSNGKKFEINLREAGAAGTITTADATAGGLVPVHIQPVVEALNEGIIYHKLGIPVAASASGEYVWPVAGKAQVKISGEGVAVQPQKVDLSKIVAKPERFACVVEETAETVTQTEGAIEGVVLRAMYAAAQEAINKLLLSPVKVDGAATIAGPLVAAKAKAVTLPAALTFKDVNGLKAKLMKAGVDMTKCAFVLSPSRYCELEATPKDAGSGIMMLENGKLAGLPVFASEAVTDDFIALGDWSNQPAGFFGGMKLVVDPYTGADRNVIKFILNFGFATATLRPEAFVVGKFTNA